MLALLLKLTLAPSLVAAATYAARRVGPRAGGLISGLPVVAAPIVLVYAIEQGDDFASSAAASAVLGMISSVAFCVVYALVAQRRAPLFALTASWAAFVVATLALTTVDLRLAVSAAVTLAAVGAGSWLLASLVPAPASAEPGPSLLIWRVGITAALVVMLTAAAGSLSPHVAGLLVPVPIITAVMAGFTHAQAGAGAAIELLAGLVQALLCFLAFFVTLAALLPNSSGPAAFAMASVAALASWAALAVASSRRGQMDAARADPSPR